MPLTVTVSVVPATVTLTGYTVLAVTLNGIGTIAMSACGPWFMMKMRSVFGVLTGSVSSPAHSTIMVPVLMESLRTSQDASFCRISMLNDAV